VFLNVLSFCVFLFITYVIVFAQSIVFDSNVYNSIVSFHRGPLTRTMLAVSEVLHPSVLMGLTALFFMLLMYFKKKKFAYYFLFSMFFGVGSAILCKTIFAVVRPESFITSAMGWSYPSAHATAVAIFFITTLYAVEEKIKDTAIEVLLTIVSVSLIALTAVSRVYLGVHWTTDVLAGTALGIFWATLSILTLRYSIDTHDRTHS